MLAAPTAIPATQPPSAGMPANNSNKAILRIILSPHEPRSPFGQAQ
jgi:hypothetical protein